MSEQELLTEKFYLHLHMRFPQLKDRFINFWTLQVTGWTTYWLHMLSLASLEYSLHNLKLITWTFLTQLIGFLVTSVLRLFYRTIDYKKKKLSVLALIVAFASFLTREVWFWSDKLLDQVMTEESLPAIPLSFQDYFRSSFYDFLLILTWSLLYFAIKIWKEWEAQKKTTNELLLQAQSKQLQMLRSQINPHFLFNSLSSLRALIDENAHSAREMVGDLSSFLRYSLMERNSSVSNLKNEIEAIKHYLAIEKRRYEDKLQIEFDIAENSGSLELPSYILLPLVENSVKYGMQTSKMPMCLSITVKNMTEEISIEVRNTGHLLSTNSGSTGTGLQNIKLRLEQMYPDHNFELSESGGIVSAIIKINKIQENTGRDSGN